MAAPTIACFIVTLLLDTLVAHEFATSLAPGNDGEQVSEIS
jgi:hypothetical protein